MSVSVRDGKHTGREERWLKIASASLGVGALCMIGVLVGWVGRSAVQSGPQMDVARGVLSVGIASVIIPAAWIGRGWIGWILGGRKASGRQTWVGTEAARKAVMISLGVVCFSAVGVVALTAVEVAGAESGVWLGMCQIGIQIGTTGMVGAIGLLER